MKTSGPLTAHSHIVIWGGHTSLSKSFFKCDKNRLCKTRLKLPKFKNAKKVKVSIYAGGKNGGRTRKDIPPSAIDLNHIPIDNEGSLPTYIEIRNTKNYAQNRK